MEPRRTDAPAIHHPLDSRRRTRTGRHSSRAGIAHRTLRALHDGRSRIRGVPQPQDSPIRYVLLRPLRRTHSGHDWHDGLPAIPQRRGRSIPPSGQVIANRARRNGRCILRQGTSRHDDGVGRPARQARRHRARRRNAGSRIGGRCRHDPVNRRTVRAGRGNAGVRTGCRMQGMRITWRRMPVPRHRRHISGRCRSTGTSHHAFRAVTVRHASMDGRGSEVSSRTRNVRSQRTDEP